MTDPTGRSFLSYRRTRVNEAKLLIEAQQDIGIPTWQDLSELDEGHTDALLRDALMVETTANAVCWLTPDIEQSDVITRTELPRILKRIDRNDGFFMVPVAAGGLDYNGVSRVVGTYVGTHDLGQWNVRKAVSDPISAIAVNAACTNLNRDETRRHIRSAIDAGATRDEILTVLKMASLLAIHSCSLGAPILLEEAKAAGVQSGGRSKNANPTPAVDKVREIGQWNQAWDPFFDLDPCGRINLWPPAFGFT